MKKFFTILMFFGIVGIVFADSYVPASPPQITINQGEDFAQTWRLLTCTAYSKFGTCTGNQVPVNINGFSFKASGKRSYSESTPFINFSTAIMSNISGAVRVSLSKTKTIAFNKQQTGYFDLSMRTPDGSLVYLIKTTFITAPTATH